MSDDSDDGKVDVSKNPSPKDEAKDFSNTDERRKGADQAHELALLRGKQGPIGRLIGCSDSSLTVAFVLLVFGALAILVSIGFLWVDKATYEPIIEKLIAFELAVATFVFGKGGIKSE